MDEARDDHRYLLNVETTEPTIVTNGGILAHSMSVDSPLKNPNSHLSVFTTSTDASVDAIQVEVSPDNISWYTWQSMTASTSAQHDTFAIEGWRYFRLVYQNTTGSDQTVGFATSYWN